MDLLIKRRSHRKGKSMETEYGIDKAREIKMKLSSHFKLNPVNYWSGKHRSIATIEKISKSNKGKSFKQYVTEQFRINCSLGKTRENIFSGFRSKLQKRIRESQKYSDWRLFVFSRDSFTCQQCGRKEIWLEAHHKESFSNILKKNNIKTYEESLICDELWNINNGITYCNECHSKTDILRKKFKKSQ